MFEISATAIPGVLAIKPVIKTDARGAFVKTFHREFFAEQGMETTFAEVYYSVSHKNVIRGMHFQLPPYEHDKLIYCLNGVVLDVIVDLRVGSPSYKKVVALQLDGGRSEGVCVPKGCAHGFLSLSPETLLLYSVGTVYLPEADSGVRWNSIGIDWPVDSPIISERDQSFLKLDEFKSPFTFNVGI
jgi:dTDP-4-dehydrorhamnose 3,5-epimerase